MLHFGDDLEQVQRFGESRSRSCFALLCGAATIATSVCPICSLIAQSPSFLLQLLCFHSYLHHSISSFQTLFQITATTMLYSSLSPFAAFLTVATLHIPLATAAPSHRSRHVRVSRDSHVKRASAWAYKTYAASPAPSPADCVNIFACEPVDSGAAPSTPLPVQPSPSPRPNQLNYTNLTTSDLPAGIVRATTTLGAASSCPAGSTYATFSDNFVGLSSVTSGAKSNM